MGNRSQLAESWSELEIGNTSNSVSHFQTQEITPWFDWAMKQDTPVATDFAELANAEKSSLPKSPPFKPANVLKFPPVIRRPPSSTIYALQEWEGYVIGVRESEFDARLTDLTKEMPFESEEATFPFEEVSDLEAKKISIGSMFRWVVGYESSPAGKKRVSLIVFFNLPVTSKSDLSAGNAWARQLAPLLNR